MKKTIIILLHLLIIIVIISCKKYSNIQSDVNNDLYIFGRLHIQDSINDNGTTRPLLKEIPVSISYNNNPAKILYTSKTSADGYFSFLNLTKGAEYIISAETETGTGDFKTIFSVKTNILLDNTKNSLTPILLFDDTKQTGVLFTIKDNASQGLISGCNTCFFSSRQLWLTDTCANSLFTVVSNANGLALKTNMLPGKYYLLFQKQAGSLLLTARDSVIINPAGIIRKDIKLF
ncbi:MAG: hypothetical protein ABIR78_07365 [Ferruginibacter sp.]